MEKKRHDLLVIGSGPGGYVAAIRAAQLGWNVGCVDSEKVSGGTCLRVGCIPSKAMLESSDIYWEAKAGLKDHGVVISDLKLDLAAMLKRKNDIVNILTKGVDGLFAKNKVKRYVGRARIEAPSRVVVAATANAKSGAANEISVEAEHILIATGSVPATLPGVEMDGGRIGTSTDALEFPEVPKHLIVIGAGFIGLELGSVWRRLGSKVTVLEYFKRILPGMDSEMADEALRIFRRQGLEFRLGTKVTSGRIVGKDCVVEIEGEEPMRGDRVLVSVGRSSNIEGLGLEGIGINLDEKGRISVNDQFETSVKGIFAVGDVIRGPMLAHKASEEGIACVERLITGYGHVNYEAIPGIVYTQPEIASVGKTEDDLKEAGIKYRKGTFPFVANGRARCLGHREGSVKVLANAETDRVLGVHIIGPRAGDLIAEAAVAIDYAATSEDLARSCHAHPTLSEALREAALAVDKRAIHA
ncbi:MAG: dihydrolipoyl dehydrogenase [Nitrospirae bacterium]|nr:dihydrolipoyl dehydrogenase [Nitrospirota bacterium]